MATTPKNKGKRSYGPIVCLLLYLLNLILVLAYQGLFVHTIPGPEYENENGMPDFSNIDFFADCEILDTEGSNLECYILYKTPAGDVEIVELERNLFFDRYTIIEDSMETVPAVSGTQILEKPNFMGTDEIAIMDQTDIEYVSSSGLMRQQTVILGGYMGIAIILLLAQTGIYYLLKKRASVS